MRTAIQHDPKEDWDDPRLISEVKSTRIPLLKLVSNNTNKHVWGDLPSKSITLYTNGEYEEAARYCKYAILLEPDAHIYALMGIAQAAHLKSTDPVAYRDDYDEAIASCDRGITLAPAEIAPHAARALVLYWAHKHEEALDSCNNIIKIDPAFKPAHRLHNVILLKIKEQDDFHAAFNPFESPSQRYKILLKIYSTNKKEAIYNKKTMIQENKTLENFASKLGLTVAELEIAARHYKAAKNEFSGRELGESVSAAAGSARPKQRRKPRHTPPELARARMLATFNELKDIDLDDRTLSEEKRIELARAVKSAHELLKRRDLGIQFEQTLVRRAYAIVKHDQRQQAG
jgi:tetratricopeptide (TPR) repeat protein